MSGSRANTEDQNNVPERSTLWEKVKSLVKEGPKSIKGDKGSTVETIKAKNKQTKDTVDNL